MGSVWLGARREGDSDRCGVVGLLRTRLGGSTEQLGETLKAGGWRLPKEALDKLNKISARPWRYPRAFEEPMPERRAAAVKMPGMAKG